MTLTSSHHTYCRPPHTYTQSHNWLLICSRTTFPVRRATDENEQIMLSECVDMRYQTHNFLSSILIILHIYSQGKLLWLENWLFWQRRADVWEVYFCIFLPYFSSLFLISHVHCLMWPLAKSTVYEASQCSCCFLHSEIFISTQRSFPLRRGIQNRECDLLGCCLQTGLVGWWRSTEKNVSPPHPPSPKGACWQGPLVNEQLTISFL